MFSIVNDETNVNMRSKGNLWSLSEKIENIKTKYKPIRHFIERFESNYLFQLRLKHMSCNSITKINHFFYT